LEDAKERARIIASLLSARKIRMIAFEIDIAPNPFARGEFVVRHQENSKKGV
jgi:hypothetical protein